MPRRAKDAPPAPPAEPRPRTAEEKRAKEIRDEQARLAAERARFACYQQPTRADRLAAQHQNRRIEE